MEFRVNKNEHLRHVLPYQFGRCSNASETARNIYDVYAEGYVAAKSNTEMVSTVRGQFFFE